MATFHNKRVSVYWEVVLTAAWQDGVTFQLNSGQRTFAEQVELVRQKGLWSLSNPTGAAAPSHNAPHIRTGRQDHALDVDTLYKTGNARLTHWLINQGARVIHPIPQEPWHLEVPAADLKKLYLKHNARQRRLKKYRTKAAALRQSIAGRVKRGLPSPGQRKLLKEYNRMIRKLKK